MGLWVPTNNFTTKRGSVRPHPDPRRAVPRIRNLRSVRPWGVVGGPQVDFCYWFSERPYGQLSFRQWESVSQRAPMAHVRLIFTRKNRPLRPLLAPCRRCVRSQCVSHVSTGKGARVTQVDRSSLWHHRPTRTTSGDGSTHLTPHGTRTDEPCWAWR